MWEIYSIGDSAFLAMVLNGVAMLTGTGAFTKVASIGFLLGFLLTAFQGIMADGGPRFPFQRVFVAMVVFLMLYGPTTRVSIEDAYTGAVRVVDNVPVGVAAAGAFTSTLGYQITRLFEQAFGSPRMTEEGFANSLSLLLQSRQAAFGQANSPGGQGDLEKTLTHYVSDCTLIGVDLGFIQEATILRAADTLQALRFDSQTYGTLTFLPGDPATGTERNCTDAFARIQNFMADAGFQAAWEAHLAGRLGPNPFARSQDALDAVVGAGYDARLLMLNTILTHIYLQGIQAKHHADHDVIGALITESGIAQRNVQWTAEQTLFQRTIRPMMAAIEGLVYAVTPLMAFLIALGAVGLRLVGQYLTMAMWIQLWLPVMAIINLYINLVVANGMEALVNVQGIHPLSQLGLAEAQLIFSDWLGTGAMLASSVPAITLFLAYGGSFTATNLAGRMQAGDYINEKLAAPDVLEPGPVTQMAPEFQQNPVQGLTHTGAEQVLPTFNLSRDAGLNETAAQRHVVEASTGYMQTLSQGLSHAYSSGSTAFTSHTLDESLATSRSSTDQYLYKLSQTALMNTGVSSISAGGLSSAIGLNGGIAGISGTLESEYNMSQQDARSLEHALNRMSGGEQQFQADLSRRIAADAGQGSKTEMADLLNRQDQAAVERRQADVASASQQREQARAFVDRFGAAGAVGAAAAGVAVASRPALLNELYQTLQDHGLMPAAERLAGPYGIYGQNLPDHEQAFAAAGLSLLLGYADPGRPLNSIEQGSARDAGLQLLGKAVEGPRLAFGNLAGQDSLAGGIQAGSARQSFDSATITAPGPAAADLPQRAQRQIDASRQQLAAAPGTVHSTYERFQHDVKAAGSGPIEAMTQHKLDWYRDQMHSALHDPRSAGQLAAEEVGGAFMHQLVTGLSATGSALSSAVDTIVTTYNELRAKGASPQDAMMAGLNAAGDAADRVLQGYYDSRFQQARSLGLPDNLANLYAQSNLTALQQTIPGLAKYLPGHDLNPTLQSSLQELQGDPNAQQVVDLVQRAGRTSNDHYLHLAGDYLQTRQSSQTFWQSLPVKSGVPLSLDLPPVPSHLADYEATANRLLDRLVTAESNGRHHGKDGSLLESPRGAQGITQIIPATGKEPGFGVTPVQNASQQEYLRFGRDYLAAMLKEFNGDPRKALAAYNWGPGYVQDAVQQHGTSWEASIPMETKKYVQRILGNFNAG